MNSEQFEIRKIDFPQELLSLEKIWLELQEPLTVANLGSSFSIVNAAWQTLSKDQDPLFGYNRKPLILLVLENGSPVAIAPLIKVWRDKKIGPFSKRITSIEFFAHPLIARHVRFFYDIVTKHPSSRLTAAILDWLYKNERFDIVHLAYISEESPNFDSSAKQMLFSLTSSVVCPGDFATFEDYRSQIYSESLKQNIRTAFNRAQAQSLAIEVTMQEVNSQVLNVITEIARTKLDAAAFFKTGYHEFLKQVCLACGADIALVRANGRPIAYRTYLKLPTGRLEIDTHRNLEYQRLELGSLLIDRAIQDSFTRGLHIHCEGLYGGIHTERFASKLLRAYKWVGAGNSLWGGIVERAIRKAHQPEHPAVQPSSDLKKARSFTSQS